MSTATPDVTDRVLNYWFGASRSWYDSYSDMKKKWFYGGKEVDEQVESMFGDDIKTALDGGHDALLKGTKRDTLALVILLDQFTRNVYRHTKAAFSGDEKAVTIAKQSVTEMDAVRKQLSPAQRLFLYTPLMHSENVDDQKLGVRLHQEMANEFSSIEEAKAMFESINQSVKFAIDHRDTVVRFGRFPHRNEVLGRESTPEELEYLKDAKRYGQ